MHLVDDERLWTCGKGVYAEPVAELALALALAGLRGLGVVRPRRRAGRSRAAATSSVAGSRSSAAAASRSPSCDCCRPFDCHVTVVRNRVQPMDGADEVLEADRYSDALSGADVVVLALGADARDGGDHQRPASCRSWSAMRG